MCAIYLRAAPNGSTRKYSVTKRNSAAQPARANSVWPTIGGANVARDLLTDGIQLPLDEAEHLLRDNLKLRIKLNHAIEHLTDTDANRLKLFKMMAQCDSEKARWAFKQQQLQERCAHAKHQHELASKRLDVKLAQLKLETLRLEQQAPSLHPIEATRVDAPEQKTAAPRASRSA